VTRTVEPPRFAHGMRIALVLAATYLALMVIASAVAEVVDGSSDHDYVVRVAEATFFVGVVGSWFGLVPLAHGLFSRGLQQQRRRWWVIAAVISAPATNTWTLLGIAFRAPGLLIYVCATLVYGAVVVVTLRSTQAE
jgi:hypothetical protein